jgi:uncharacterized SAM-binding protein YcdF (DUF218 family)
MTDDLLLFLSKAVPQAVLPEGSLALMLLAMTVSVLVRAYRTAGMLAVLSLGLFWVCATPVVAHWAMGTLERQYMPQSADLPRADVAIVLGGAVSAPPPLQVTELSDAADRVWYAARLHRAGHVRRLVVVGGNLPWGAAAKPEAELIRQLLIEFGVPADAIRIGGTSRNTYENAIEARSILQGPPFDTALLITSAWHMPRALAVFRKAGLPVDPAPCDFRASGDLAGTILDWLPQARAFAMTSEALREWLGYALYRWKGWL